MLVNGRDSIISIVDMRTFKDLTTFEETPSYTNFSNTNKAIISPEGSMALVPSATGSIVVFDISQCKKIASLKPEAPPMYHGIGSLELNGSLLTQASTVTNNPHLHRFVDAAWQPRLGKIAAISKSGFVTVWS